jgi:hypothetical protein
MAKPTQQQWDAAKSELSGVFGRAYFLIDGYKVAAVVKQNKMRLMITVYVNGEIDGENVWHGWDSDIEQMPEIARRFYTLKSKGEGQKKIKQYEKVLGKRRAKKMGIYKRYVFAWPYFSTAGAFIAHIKKHNEDIQIVDYDTHKAALDKHLAAIAPEVESV